MTVLLIGSPLSAIESRSALWLGNGLRRRVLAGTIRAISTPRRVITTSPPTATRLSRSLKLARASLTFIRVISLQSMADVHIKCTPGPSTDQSLGAFVHLGYNPHAVFHRRIYRMERTLIILKPDAVQRGIVGQIITR